MKIAAMYGVAYAAAVVFAGALLVFPIRLLSPDGSTMPLGELLAASFGMMLIGGSQTLVSAAPFWVIGGALLGALNASVVAPFRSR